MLKRLVATGKFLSDRSVIRRLPNLNSNVYLTFDDGPSADFTPKVLDILDKNDAKACFFLVANRAKEQPKLVEDIIQRGHSIGNHSLDHRYSHFFKNRIHLKKWIETSQNSLQSISGTKIVGFRPPLGILTPELLALNRDSSLPLILWNHRFFDTLRPWSIKHAQQALHKTQSGDIILLHDVQPSKFQDQFLITLDFYLNQLKNKNFKLAALPLPKAQLDFNLDNLD